jgi:uncharacterized protein YndB with AHSA1/START domain
MGVEIRSDRVYRFALSRSELWRLLTRVEDYSSWWPWVRQLDAAGLEPGDVWQCAIQPPLPYALRCSLRLRAVVEPELIEAEVTGDLVGVARIELQGEGTETEVRVVSELAAASTPVRVASRAFPTLARWGHDWVLDTAARQFSAAVALERS